MGLISYGAFCSTQDAPFFFLYKSALTHHRPKASGGIPFGARALLTKAPPGLPPEGPAMPPLPTGHMAVIAGQLAALSADAAPLRSGTEHRLPTVYAPLCASHLLFVKRSKSYGLRAWKGGRACYGYLPFRGEGHHPKRGPDRLRRCRLYELFPYLQ